MVSSQILNVKIVSRTMVLVLTLQSMELPTFNIYFFVLVDPYFTFSFNFKTILEV